MSRRISVLVCFLLLSLAASAWGDGDGGGEPDALRGGTDQRGAEGHGCSPGRTAFWAMTLWKRITICPPPIIRTRTPAGFRPSTAVRLRWYGYRQDPEIDGADGTGMAAQIPGGHGKGDAEAITKLTQEYQAMIASIQLQAANASASHKEPIVIDIRLNQYQTAAIDPDGVVLRNRVSSPWPKNPTGRTWPGALLFDPIALKQTETLSQVRPRISAGRDGGQNQCEQCRHRIRGAGKGYPGVGQADRHRRRS